jgi:hypothetical protein
MSQTYEIIVQEKGKTYSLKAEDLKTLASLVKELGDKKIKIYKYKFTKGEVSESAEMKVKLIKDSVVFRTVKKSAFIPKPKKPKPVIKPVDREVKPVVVRPREKKLNRDEKLNAIAASVINRDPLPSVIRRDPVTSEIKRAPTPSTGKREVSSGAVAGNRTSERNQPISRNPSSKATRAPRNSKTIRRH